uniref:Uncharacterized protein n=1 Tax=Tetraselmis sp. GSL018 TaxID=582737 RepID=A0A061QYX8_9CHLO
MGIAVIGSALGCNDTAFPHSISLPNFRPWEGMQGANTDATASFPELPKQENALSNEIAAREAAKRSVVRAARRKARERIAAKGIATRAVGEPLDTKQGFSGSLSEPQSNTKAEKITERSNLKRDPLSGLPPGLNRTAFEEALRREREQEVLGTSHSSLLCGDAVGVVAHLLSVMVEVVALREAGQDMFPLLEAHQASCFLAEEEARSAAASARARVARLQREKSKNERREMQERLLSRSQERLQARQRATQWGRGLNPAQCEAARRAAARWSRGLQGTGTANLAVDTTAGGGDPRAGPSPPGGGRGRGGAADPGWRAEPRMGSPRRAGGPTSAQGPLRPTSAVTMRSGHIVASRPGSGQQCRQIGGQVGGWRSGRPGPAAGTGAWRQRRPMSAAPPAAARELSAGAPPQDVLRAASPPPAREAVRSPKVAFSDATLPEPALGGGSWLRPGGGSGSPEPPFGLWPFGPLRACASEAALGDHQADPWPSAPAGDLSAPGVSQSCLDVPGGFAGDEPPMRINRVDPQERRHGGAGCAGHGGARAERPERAAAAGSGARAASARRGASPRAGRGACPPPRRHGFVSPDVHSIVSDARAEDGLQRRLVRILRQQSDTIDEERGRA